MLRNDIPDAVLLIRVHVQSESMREHVERLLVECPGAEPEYYENSGWLEDEDLERLDSIVAEYGAIYERRVSKLSQLLGKPDQTETTHREAIARWLPEALRASCWIKEGKTLCLALVHHDAETPVGIMLQCLSDSEIEERSA